MDNYISLNNNASNIKANNNIEKVNVKGTHVFSTKFD